MRIIKAKKEFAMESNLLLKLSLCLMVIPIKLHAVDLKSAIELRREQIRAWAPVCQNGKYTGQYSEKHNKCKQGDLAIFAGLGCLAATLAGDYQTINDRCGDIEQSQGTNGRWWRGPTRVDDENNDLNAFSRDQSKGVLAYLIARGSELNPDSNDREEVKRQALDWINWMDEEGEGKMCTRATSNLCTILSAEPYAVYNALDLFPHTNSREFKKSKTFIHLNNLKDVFWTLPMETVLTPRGYKLHLKATTVLLRKALAKIKQTSLKELAMIETTSKIIYQKDPKNLYFEFLHKNILSKEYIEKVFAKCPAENPKKARYYDWQWQRDTAVNAWRDTNGHDCIFLLNLILTRLN